jgi:hypothetical protein
MLPDSAPPIALLLHEGGWDEVLMVAAALGIAYLVIVWSGRKRDHEDDDWDDDEASEDGHAVDSPPEQPTNTKS